MKILLVDVDSKIPNLALMKISAWHKEQGDEVGFCIENPDKVYISCIFTKNAEQARGIAKFYPDAWVDIGGSGIDLTYDLPIYKEFMKPDYDLYPSIYSQGYTTRGCIRNCGFCIVPKKEGRIEVRQFPSKFHDSRFDTCMIMDNNLFAAPDHWDIEVLSWFINNNVKMLSPQGWDIRLLTPERSRLLSLVKHAGMIHFAWDNLDDEYEVIDGINLLKADGFDLKHKVSFYVLSGYDSDFGDDLYRVQRLRDLGVQAFVMPYHKNDKRINDLARWANRPWLYWSIPFSDYKKVPA